MLSCLKRLQHEQHGIGHSLVDNMLGLARKYKVRQVPRSPMPFAHSPSCSPLQAVLEFCDQHSPTAVPTDIGPMSVGVQTLCRLLKHLWIDSRFFWHSITVMA